MIGQFKGNRKYYQQKTSNLDLVSIFKDEATAVNETPLSSATIEGDILTDLQLDRILDRTAVDDNNIEDSSIEIVNTAQDIQNSLISI